MEERLSPSSDDYIELLFHWHRYFIAAKYARGKRVLDLACGDGYSSFFVAQYARTTVGMDIDYQVIERAKKKYRRDNLTYIAGAADQIPFEDAAFDMIFSFETIEHLAEQDQRTFLREVKRVLSPAGLFIISTPDKHRTDSFRDKNPYHIKEFYLEEFEALLKKEFAWVSISLQEINLASLTWPLAQNPLQKSPGEYRIACNDGTSSATEQPMRLHLYMIAFCRNKKKYAGIAESSICYDISRKPLEVIWQKNDLLTQAAEEKDQHIRELEGEAANACRLIRELEAEVDELAVAAREKDQSIAALAQENTALTQNVAALQQVLAGIHSSHTWQLLQKYRHLIDSSPAGKILKPVRNVIVRNRDNKK
ncbi:MAG: class I SAM-dependent methyltransferase [Desulfotomaculaceae bacterium]|nr:class I SAM-dependent methyltransferase [Desulfotomaculaceae bacterium]MDD4766381.1 class I SAM-dependent methyltransferase [Desulfotomaculaceae bacterium]